MSHCEIQKTSLNVWQVWLIKPWGQRMLVGEFDSLLAATKYCGTSPYEVL